VLTVVITMIVGRTVEHLKKELQQKGDIGLVAEVHLVLSFIAYLLSMFSNSYDLISSDDKRVFMTHINQGDR